MSEHQKYLMKRNQELREENARLRSFLWMIALLGVILILITYFAAPAGAHPHGLNDVGVHVLGTCETDNRPHIEGLYDGEHQWRLDTWNAAVKEIGWTQYVGLTPNFVDQGTQREVAKSWWSSSQHHGPHTQWPNCYDDALRAMGFDEPCIGRNVFGCGATHQIAIPAPIPTFTG